MCLYILTYHFLRGVNHLKCLEMALQILPVEIKAEHVRGSAKWATPPAHHQPTPLLCVCQAQRNGQLRMCFLLHFGRVGGGGEASVGKGGQSTCIWLLTEGPVLWLRHEHTWFQAHTRADIKCQESITSHRPDTEMLRCGQLYATWKSYVFWSQIPKTQNSKAHA